MMKDHLDATTREVLARLNENWEADVDAYDAVHEQALAMADMLSSGIIAQFPSRFRPQPEASFLCGAAALDRLGGRALAWREGAVCCPSLRFVESQRPAGGSRRRGMNRASPRRVDRTRRCTSRP